MSMVSESIKELHPARIIVVDDDTDLLLAICRFLSSCGLQVGAFHSGWSVVDFLKSSPTVSCIICDVRLPDIDGIDMIAEVRLCDPDLPVVLISGYGDIPMAVRAMRRGAFDFMEKPFDLSRLQAVVEAALVRYAVAVGGREATRCARLKVGALTRRQREVFHLVCDGLTSRQIADELGCSVGTISSHRAQIMARLGCSQLDQLIKIRTLIQ